MQLTESSIYISLVQLRSVLYHCQFLMQKADRIIYGTPLMKANGKALSSFILAFTITDKKLEYLEEAMGYFYVLKTDINFCVSQNIIHFKTKIVKSKDNGGNVQEEKVANGKIELLKIVAKIDNDMCKWRASLAKSKTLCD